MASNPQHEPTMEEILASIRKIISEDTPAEAPAGDAPAAAPKVEADILELTQEVTPAAAVKAENDVIFQTIEEPAPAKPEPPKMETPAPATPPSASNDIFSDTTRKAMDDTFANIPEDDTPAPAPRAMAALGPVDGSSVETVFERAVRESFEPVLQKHLVDNSAAVIEGMKPLIREWMDEHFPALLEGAVRAEVERVVKARGNKR